MISITAAEHAVAFPSKLKSSLCGHIYNMVLQQDLDNGTVRGIGDYVSFDQYKDVAAPAAFAGKVVDVAANGNFYVRVTAVDADEPAVLIYDDPIIKETNDRRFQSAKYFYNPQGATVRGFELAVGDIFEVSAAAFTTPTTVAVGKSVSANSAGKLVAA